MLVFGILLSLVAGYGAVQGRFYLRRRRLHNTSVQTLVERLQPVNLGAICQIAENFLNPSRLQLRLEPPVMWAKIGEVEGLKMLSTNADAILDLAAVASRWDRTEGRITAEMIRRDGVRLKRAVWKIRLVLHFGLGEVCAPFQLQEAAAAYYLMRTRLLGLYQGSHTGLYPRLAEVL
jgi:hypothetical protein